MVENVPSSVDFMRLGSTIVRIETTTGRILSIAQNTQFADYHGHGWNFRGIFKRDRNGNLLDADGNMSTYGTDKAHIVDPQDPEKWRKSCASYSDPAQRDLCLASADPAKPGVEGKFVPPDRFIPLAERTGLIGPLGQLILTLACHQIAEWREAFGSVVPVAVNVSAMEFRQRDLVGEIKQVLADTGLDNLGDAAERLRRRYAAVDHPAAREIVDWLDGRWRITAEMMEHA